MLMLRASDAAPLCDFAENLLQLFHSFDEWNDLYIPVCFER